MPDDRKYNGWTNYETWAVKLHLDNDQGTYDEMGEIAKSFNDEVRGYGDYSYTVSRRLIIGGAVRDYVEELVFPDTDSLTLLQTDLIRAALSEVNWDEIGESYADEYPYEGNDDDEEEDE